MVENVIDLHHEGTLLYIILVRCYNSVYLELVVIYNDKTLRKFIEWSKSTLKKSQINNITIDLRRLMQSSVSIDLPHHFSKKYYNFVELDETEEMEMFFCIYFEDGISECSIDVSFKNNKYEIKKFVLGNFCVKMFSNPNDDLSLIHI